uniref:Uncharacterized protein n=1 Tax=Anguilla anguilla TaxID=7936 RepID=A0A0E9VNE3_ANGAN
MSHPSKSHLSLCTAYIHPLNPFIAQRTCS